MSADDPLRTFGVGLFSPTMSSSPSTNRPLIVTLFETLGILMLGLELVIVEGLGVGDVVSTLVMLWVILAVTRRKSSTARWIFSAMAFAGLALMAYVVGTGTLEPGWVTWTGWLLGAASILQLVLLWSPTMSAWLRSKRDGAPQIGVSA